MKQKIPYNLNLVIRDLIFYKLITLILLIDLLHQRNKVY
jgi:hypothetical protein